MSMMKKLKCPNHHLFLSAIKRPKRRKVSLNCAPAVRTKPVAKPSVVREGINKRTVNLCCVSVFLLVQLK